jgi:hypothetical protein
MTDRRSFSIETFQIALPAVKDKSWSSNAKRFAVLLFARL